MLLVIISREFGAFRMRVRSWSASVLEAAKKIEILQPIGVSFIRTMHAPPIPRWAVVDSKQLSFAVLLYVLLPIIGVCSGIEQRNCA
jgi:hypothetical protein